MAEFDDLVEKVKQAGHQVEFYGPKGEPMIDTLAAALDTTLPPSFRRFLGEYGGGGVVGEWVSGIYDDQPLLANEGSVFGDTKRWRERHALPPKLVAIYTQDDEVCWCLDTAKVTKNGENPVVSFDLSDPSHTTPIADSFADFFKEYLEMHAQAL